MAWFICQSLVMIAAAFLLGVLVGWLIWGALWRRNRVDESAAVAAERERHRAELADRDAEITRLRETIAAGTAPEPDPAGSTSDTAAVVATTGVPDPAVEEVAELEPVAEAEHHQPEETEPARISPAAAVQEPDDTTEADAEAEPAAVVVAGPADPADQPVDDLERIEGIGPKMANALVQAGIRTYAQLAAADEDTLRTAIKARGLKFAPSLVTWSRQARLLADGDEEGFEQLTRSLTAGREGSRS